MLQIIATSLTGIIVAILGFLFAKKLKKMDIDAAEKREQQKLDFEKAEVKRIENEKIANQQRDEKDERRFENQTRQILEKVGELELKMGTIEDILVTHVGDSDFRLRFRNKVSNLAMNLLKASDLDEEYKSVLAYWFSNIETFSLDFWYSDYRKSEPEALKIKLNEKLEILLSNFSQHINLSVKEIREYNSSKVLFSQYLTKTNFHGKARVLILAFGNNGFDVDTKFTTLVIDHINSIHADFITSLRVWRRCKRVGFQLDNEDAA